MISLTSTAMTGDFKEGRRGDHFLGSGLGLVASPLLCSRGRLCPAFSTPGGPHGNPEKRLSSFRKGPAD